MHRILPFRIVLVNIEALAIVILLLFLVNCERDLDIEPAVLTGSVDSVAATTVLIQAEIIDIGGGVTAHGHCYGTTPEPDIDGDRTDFGEAGELVAYSSEISGLAPGSEYYIRAYVTSEGKPYYGKEIKVITHEGKAEVETNEVLEVKAKSAQCGGKVVSAGGDEVVDYGLCWSKNNSFELPNCEGSSSEGKGLGEFRGYLTDLDPGSEYFTRSYAITTVDTAYGEVRPFTTSNGIVKFSNVAVSELSSNSFGLNFSIQEDGGDSIKAVGICWGEESDPDLSQNIFISFSETGSYFDEIYGLKENTLYYVRPFAINSIDTYYGKQVLAQTNSNLALTTTPVFNIRMSTAVSGGSIVGVEGSTIFEKGICWSQDVLPTIESNTFIDNSDDLVFSSPMIGLIGNSQYNVRAYVITEDQTVYGDVQSFTTEDGKIEITTVSPTRLSGSSAQSGGIISEIGGSDVSEKGICWATSSDPTIADYRINSGSGSDSYQCIMEDLECGQNYKIRAYAINEAGIQYGNEVQYSTEICPEPPVVAYPDTSGGTRTSIDIWSNVTADGGATVIAKGFCWGTSQDPDLSDYYSTQGTGIGSFSGRIDGLDCGTVYYIRAYATNSVGTSYSPEISIHTQSCNSPPTVNTLPITQISDYSAKSGGTIVNDGGALISAKGICWSTSPDPTISDYYSYEGSGNTDFTSQISGLNSYTTYYVRAYATNSEGTAYGEVQIFKTSTLVDYDGNVYETVVIGDQTWMKENLRVTHYADGTAINNVEIYWDLLGDQDKAYCWYNNNESNKDSQGALYNWAAAMNGAGSSTSIPSGVQGVCPDGWHLPSGQEFGSMFNYISEDNGGYEGGGFSFIGTPPSSWMFNVGRHMKSTFGWNDGGNGTDDYGFKATPSGYSLHGSFYGLGSYGGWWTTGETYFEGTRYTNSTYLKSDHPDIYNVCSSPLDGHSVRCVKD